MYTKEQRLEIYKTLLRESLSPTEVMVDKHNRSTKELGICWMYRMLYGRTDLYGRFEETLPELFEKSTECGVYMFRDWDHREEALAKCIVELQEGGGIV